MKSFTFGNNPKMADELLRLVLAGKKTATCSAVIAGESAIEVGEKSVIKDSQNRERVIIETIEFSRRKFYEVDSTFAKDEGEGDLSLEYWRKAHKDFFTKEGTYSEDMDLFCERFKVIEILPIDN